MYFSGNQQIVGRRRYRCREVELDIGPCLIERVSRMWEVGDRGSESEPGVDPGWVDRGSEVVCRNGATGLAAAVTAAEAIWLEFAIAGLLGASC